MKREAGAPSIDARATGHIEARADRRYSLPGRMAPTSFPNDLPVTPELARSHKLNEAEYAVVLKALGRTPSYAELGVFSVMWSEHCSYKSSRMHLDRKSVV